MPPTIVTRFEWKGVDWLVVDFHRNDEYGNPEPPDLMPDLPYVWRGEANELASRA